MIHSAAIVDPKANLASDVTVGPWTIIGAGVDIDSGTVIGSHVVIKGPTRIGKDNRIFQFASVGEDPQDKKYQGGVTQLEIGDRNVIREYCSVNRGTELGGGLTQIGNDNLLMASVHIAHDCRIADHTIFANYSGLAGHVLVDDYAILSAYAAVHQFCRIGAHSFVAKATMVVQDVLPYFLVAGYDAKACGLNKEGLKRRDFSVETINRLRQAYKIIVRQGLTVETAVQELLLIAQGCPEVNVLITALQQAERGVTR